MLFNKPKTIQNFILPNEFGRYAIRNKWGVAEEEDEEEEADKDRKIQVWGERWTGMIQDHLFFWYLMVIFENFKHESLGQEIDLTKFNLPQKYTDAIAKYDSDFYSESEA